MTDPASAANAEKYAASIVSVPAARDAKSASQLPRDSHCDLPSNSDHSPPWDPAGAGTETRQIRRGLVRNPRRRAQLPLLPDRNGNPAFDASRSGSGEADPPGALNSGLAPKLLLLRS